MIARGKYNIKSKFVDDDKVTHLEWLWVRFDSGLTKPQGIGDSKRLGIDICVKKYLFQDNCGTQGL